LNGSRIIFVGGSPRSGTTLVQNILNSHKDICGGSEFDYIIDIVRLRDNLKKSVISGRINDFFSEQNLDTSICLFIENLLLPFADKYGCNLISEKTPSNILVFKQLLSICPKAKFIHVIRDPRAVISSMLEVGKRGKEKGIATPAFTRSPTVAINCVRKYLTAGLLAKQYNPDRIFEVQYEKLVKNPEMISKEMCGFIDVDWDPEMILPKNKKQFAHKFLTRAFYDENMYYRNPETKEIFKWKQNLSKSQIVMISTAFEKNYTLNELGYSFSTDSKFQLFKIIYKLKSYLNYCFERILKKIMQRIKKIPFILRLYRRLLTYIREPLY
jgi:hypothetical protein